MPFRGRWRRNPSRGMLSDRIDRSARELKGGAGGRGWVQEWWPTSCRCKGVLVWGANTWVPLVLVGDWFLVGDLKPTRGGLL